MRKLPVLGAGSTEAGAAEHSRMAVYAALPKRPASFGAAGLPELADGRGRVYRYLRLSVTDRCDLACVYCMPPGGEEEHAIRRDLLSFEEAARVVQVFAAQGIRRVRFTGGEPLVRKDVVRLVELVHRRTAVEELVMTTKRDAARGAGPSAPRRGSAGRQRQPGQPRRRTLSRDHAGRRLGSRPGGHSRGPRRRHGGQDQHGAHARPDGRRGAAPRRLGLGPRGDAALHRAHAPRGRCQAEGRTHERG